MQSLAPIDRPPLAAPFYGIGFVAALTRFFRKYADFTGRAGRAEYWWVVLWSIIASTVLSVLAVVIGSTPAQQEVIDNVVNGILALVMLVPSLTLTARRLHDTGRSGWWQLLGLVPVVGWVVLIVWYCTAARPGGARFDRS